MCLKLASHLQYHERTSVQQICIKFFSTSISMINNLTTSDATIKYISEVNKTDRWKLATKPIVILYCISHRLFMPAAALVVTDNHCISIIHSMMLIPLNIEWMCYVVANDGLQCNNWIWSFKKQIRGGKDTPNTEGKRNIYPQFSVQL